LGALPAAEAADFEAQMARDADLRAEVERLRVAVDALPASPIQLAPPPELKDRIMSVVNAEAELLRAAGPDADRPQPARRRWSWRGGLAVAAAACAVLVVAVVIGVSGGSDQVVTASLGHARLIERGSGHSTLTATGLPSPGAGRVYQVWLQHKGGRPRPTNALFGARRDGIASVDVPGSLKNVDAVLVTSEPEGGSDAPTRPPVIEVHPA
jgi:anti-sigma-K factor RskA